MTSLAMTPATPTRPRHSPELLAVAKRMVWFKPPESTLANDVFFLNYLMVYGTAEDIVVARQRYDDDDFRRALCGTKTVFGRLIARRLRPSLQGPIGGSR